MAKLIEAKRVPQMGCQMSRTGVPPGGSTRQQRQLERRQVGLVDSSAGFEALGQQGFVDESSSEASHEEEQNDKG